ASNNLVAVGCATATLNADDVPLSIKMNRIVAAASCGNGKVEATEQCEPPGTNADAVCDAHCHTKEELLSNGPQVTVEPPASTTPASFFWPQQSGQAGRFFAFFTSVGSGQSDVAMRVMGDSLQPLTDPPVTKTAFLMPVDPGAAQYPPTSPAA